MKNVKLYLIIAFLSVFSFNLYAFEWALYGVDGFEFHSGLSRASSRESHFRLHGYIDASGKVAIPYQFKSAGDFNGYCAEVETDEGYGLINVKGEYVLPIGDYFIRSMDRVPNGYSIKDNKTGKYAFFDGTRFVTGFDYDYIDDYKYPFIGFSDHTNSENGFIYNVVSQERFYNSFALRQGNYFVVSNPENIYVFDLNGEPVDKSKFMQSSKGVKIFYDEKTGKAGLMDSKTGNIIEPAKYRAAKNEELWTADVVILYDSISPEYRRISVAFNAAGKRIVAADPTTPFIIIDKDYVGKHGMNFNDASNFSYYDFKGNELTELKGTDPYEVAPNYYFYAKNNSLYNIKTHKVMTDVDNPHLSEGMLRYRDIKSNNQPYYFLNVETGEKIGPYDRAGLFNEGVAVVEKGNKRLLVNQKGKEYSFPNGIKLRGNIVSEGVIYAYDDDKGVDGFIYNPFGHGGWTYSQKGGDISDYSFMKLEEEAVKLAQEGKYATAMNKFYHLMMLKPEKSTSFNNYAACLFNLGKNDEALTAINVSLSYWPDNEYALNLKDKIVSTIEEENRRAQSNASYEDAEQSASIWDAIGNFANALANTFGGYSAGNAYVPSYSASSEASSQPSSSSGGGNYQSQYQNWERLAEKHYNSLTNLGYSSTSSSGKKSGSAGGKTSSGNYVSMKRSLREAQNEMRSIRRKAAQAGVNIPQSKWETATVSF